MGNAPALFRQVDLERAARVADKHSLFVKINPDGSMELLPLSLARIAGTSAWVPIDGAGHSEPVEEVDVL